jgi:hypothetical protein
MIISRWKGFEIDSSEGYYGFFKEATDAEECWRYLNKILSSPLLWNKAAFSFGGKDELTENIIYSHLTDLANRGKIEKTENKYQYCPYSYAASLQELKILIDRVQENLKQVSINFCVRPLDSLDADECARLKTWYLGQFSSRKEGESRWRDYQILKEEDLTLGGNPDYTDSFARNYPFEANLRFDLDAENKLSIFMAAGDPSFIIYLISTIFPGYDLEYIGDHYISIDFRPDKLKKMLE